MYATTSSDTGNTSVDDSILDYLSKRGASDQTEKLALTRISSKMELSIEQVTVSINRLCEKHLIRKISWQGKTSFELTPKGKSTIETISKAQTERITRQLQEAINQERKAKLRSNIFKKLKSEEQAWQSYRVPDKNKVGEIERETAEFLISAKEIESKQPLCINDPQNYDQQFSEYKSKIEKLIEQNNKFNRIVSDYAKIKDNKISISDVIKRVDKTISKYEPLEEARAQINELNGALSRLKSIQSQLENFEQGELSRLEELKTKLADGYRLLEILRKPTHEFTSIRRASLTEKAWYPDPEGPIKSDRKTTAYPLVEKCAKCGIQRRSKPVDIG